MESSTPSNVAHRNSSMLEDLPGEEAPLPDPRWPSLSRWSARSSSSFTKSPVTKLQITDAVVANVNLSSDMKSQANKSIGSITHSATILDGATSTALESTLDLISLTEAHVATAVKDDAIEVAGVKENVVEVPDDAAEGSNVEDSVVEASVVKDGVIEGYVAVVEGSTVADSVVEVTNVKGDDVEGLVETIEGSNVEDSAGIDYVGLELPEKSSAPFVPSLGAWTKPLKVALPSSPLVMSVQQEGESNENLPSPTNWPSLSSQREGKSKASKVMKKLTTKVPAHEAYTPEVKADGNFRFPWAAKMNPDTRNLYRTTTPTYLEDGTPKVTIPSHLLLHGPENQKEYVIGQFFRCSTPPGGLIHAVVNRIWGRKCSIFSRKLGESSYLFHIPDESTRSWILQRGLWHVDGCLMFVASWSPASTFSLPEISTVPVWVTLKNIPSRLYSRKGISRIASGLGEPMLTYKPRLDPTLMGEAKIMVEVELDKPFPQRIALDDKKGTITMVDVEYSWIPTKCSKCGHLGHKKSRCLLPSVTNLNDLPLASGDHSFSAEVVTISVDVHDSTLAPASTLTMSAANPEDGLPHVSASTGTAQHSALQTIASCGVYESASESVLDLALDSAKTVSDFAMSTLTAEVAPSSTSIVSLVEPAITIANEAPLNDPILISTSVEVVPIATGNEVFSATKVNEAISESAKLLKNTTVANDISINRFKLLGFTVSDEDSDDSDRETGLVDLLSPSGQRLLRERPVKPSFKAMEMQASSKARGRGNRGRGNRGGRG